MDSMLLRTLIDKKKNWLGWVDACVPKYVLRLAVRLINSQFGSDLNCSDITLRLKLLKQRYETFNEVVATHGVRWDFFNKVVHADEAIWQAIFKVHILISYIYIMSFWPNIKCGECFVEELIRRSVLPP